MFMNRVVAGSDANTYGRSAHASSPERLARQYMPLVLKIAWHVHGRVSSAIEIEDLLQIGMVALVEAANGFEDRGLGFASYAQMRVRGAMIAHLRHHAPMTPSALSQRKQLERISNRLEPRLGRAPLEAAHSPATVRDDGPP